MSPGGAMVRRLLLIAVLATLAVALPAAADGEPSDPGTVPPICLPLEVCDDDGSDANQNPPCQTVTADPTASPGEAIAVDPDGCIRDLVREVLGWPPAQRVFGIGPIATVLNLL